MVQCYNRNSLNSPSTYMLRHDVESAVQQWLDLIATSVRTVNDGESWVGRESRLIAAAAVTALRSLRPLSRPDKPCGIRATQPHRPRNSAVSGYSTDVLRLLLTFTVRSLGGRWSFLEGGSDSFNFTVPVFMGSKNLSAKEWADRAVVWSKWLRLARDLNR